MTQAGRFPVPTLDANGRLVPGQAPQSLADAVVAMNNLVANMPAMVAAQVTAALAGLPAPLTLATLDARYAPRPNTQALAWWHAALAQRNIKAPVWGAAGSSTTYGNNASSTAKTFVGRLLSMYLASHPLDAAPGTTPTVKMLAAAVAALPFPAAGGPVFVNAGVGGTTSADYLTATTAAQFASCAPDLAAHMVGSNDLRNGMALATFEANLRMQIDRERTLNTKGHSTLLVASYERFDAATPVALWEDYIGVMATVGASDPDAIAFVNLNPSYELLGIPGPDPLDLIDTDMVHGRDDNHLLIATLLHEATRPRLLLSPPTRRPLTLRYTVAPAISGDATTGVGAVLTVSTGTWVNTLGGVATSYAYQWRRAGVAIAGATATSYTTVQADIGQQLTVAVTATRAGWVTGTAVSAAVSSSAPTPLSNTVLPAMTGTATTGSTLSCDNGTWSGSPTSYTYAWQRDGNPIAGATANTYLLATADVGHVILCKVTAAKANTASVTASSNYVTAAAAQQAAIANSTAPAVSGTAATGLTLTTTSGTWTNSPTAYTYQWTRDGAAIAGATAATYLLVVADEGKAIGCTVTATRSGYTSAAAGSNTVTPPDISSGLNFEVDADSITGVANGADVTAWNTIAGLVASFQLANATSAAPSLITAATAGINGHQAVDFDPTNSEYIRTASTTAPSIAGPCTYAYVIRPDADTANAGRIATSRDASNYHGVSNAASGGVLVQGAGGSSFTRTGSLAGAWHIVVVVHNGASSLIYVDGTASPTTGSLGAGGSSIGVTLGSSVNLTANTFYDGKIGCIRNFNRVLTAAQVSALIASLGAKYGISVAA